MQNAFIYLFVSDPDSYLLCILEIECYGYGEKEIAFFIYRYSHSFVS